MVYPLGQEGGGSASADIFWQGGGVNFRDFDVFYGRSLTSYFCLSEIKAKFIYSWL